MLPLLINLIEVGRGLSLPFSSFVLQIPTSPPSLLIFCSPILSALASPSSLASLLQRTREASLIYLLIIYLACFALSTESSSFSSLASRFRFFLRLPLCTAQEDYVPLKATCGTSADLIQARGTFGVRFFACEAATNDSFPSSLHTTHASSSRSVPTWQNRYFRNPPRRISPSLSFSPESSSWLFRRQCATPAHGTTAS